MSHPPSPPTQLQPPTPTPDPNPHNKKRTTSPSAHRKPCTLCNTPRDVLVRCRIDETLTWHFICPSQCWKQVSGGEIDGPGKPYYTYGGMWKNKHAGVSAKKPKRKGRGHENIKGWMPAGEYITNDRVRYGAGMWVCRRSHVSREETMPGAAYRYWKEWGAEEDLCAGDEL